MIGATLVHMLTATGGVLGLLSVYALLLGDIQIALLLNMTTFIVDGIDGPLARKINISERIPWFDGAVIDMVIDFFNYSMWPALFLLMTDFMSAPANLLCGCAIVLSSIYWYGCNDQKADDWSFKRFPCLWNIVIIYLFLAGASQWASIAVIAFLSVMSFVPAYFPHGFRLDKVVPSRWGRTILIFLVSTSVGAAFFYVLFYPRLPDLVWQYSLLYCVIYASLCVVLTVRAYKRVRIAE